MELERSQPALPSLPASCAYCGAPLDHRYYFCRACATPYQTTENVITPYKPRELVGTELVSVKAPSAWPLFYSYLSVLVVAVMVQLAGIQIEPDVMFFGMTAVLFVLTAVQAAVHWRVLKEQLCVLGFNQLGAWIGLLCLVPALALNFGYHRLLMYIMQVKPENPFEELQAKVPAYVMILVISVLPGITEEIAFRGLLQTWLQRALGNWWGLVLASALFAALHLNVLSFPYLMLIGMLLGWVRQKTGSLYPGMLMHCLHNFVVLQYA